MSLYQLQKLIYEIEPVGVRHAVPLLWIFVIFAFFVVDGVAFTR